MTAKQKQDDKRKYIDADLTKVKALENGAFEGIVATNGIDRHGEVINIDGIDTKTYLTTNPIVLFGHDYWEAESIIGRAVSLTKTTGGQLLSNFELFTDVNPKALLVSKLIKKGVCSLSIGFVPKEIDGDEYTKSEMVEFSVVPVPANGEAAITARSLGLTKKDMGAIKKAFAGSDIVTITDDSVEVKGALQDELDEDAAQDAKYDNFEDVAEVYYAFCEVYLWNSDSQVDDFGALLKEFIGLLQQIADGTYVDADDDSEDDASDATQYSSVASALKKIDKEAVKAFIAKHATKDVDEAEVQTGEIVEPKALVDNNTTKDAAGDGDVTWIQQLAQDFGLVADKMTDMQGRLNDKAAQTAAGGAPSDQDMSDAESTGDNAGGMEATNTVKVVKEVVAEPVEEAQEVETEETAKQIEVDGIKVDITDAKADTIKQLAKALQAIAVELESDASQIESSTTNGVSSPTVRKRKLVLREAKKKVVTVDKMVELTLRQLNNN